MKKNTLLTFFGSALLGLTLVACGPNEHDPDPSTPALDVTTKVANFASEEAKPFVASNGYSNEGVFNTVWNAADCNIEDNELHLSISEAPEGLVREYYSGEYRSLNFYGYGDFGTRMKPAKTVGTASTFFLYTGEWDSQTLHPSTGETDTRNPDNEEGAWDEIDIEFLGKDTTKVQFNYFTNGQGGNEFMYNLGFDASEDWHEYGFRWEEGRITWFVDGRAVYTATKNIPTHPGRILTNYWCGTSAADGWMGHFNYDENVKVDKYQWISASSEGHETHKEPDPEPGPGSDINWDDIEAVELTDLQGDTDVYNTTFNLDNTGVDVTYEDVGATYQNINFAVPSEVEDARALSFKVHNYGTEPVVVRADAMSNNTHGEQNIKAENLSARQDGVTVHTDLEWGGSFFTIAPGTTSLCEIVYSNAITRILFMIDSTTSGESSGHIFISDLKFSSDGPYPEPVIDWSGIKASELTDLQGDTNVYTTQFNHDNTAVDVTYEGVATTYQNINFAIPAEASEARVLSFKIQNLGSENVEIRADAMSNNTHGEHNIKAENTSAEQDGQSVRTDLEWGGSYFTIIPETTSLCEIRYGAEITRVLFMIDSTTSGESSGHIVISDLKFAVSGSDPEPEPEAVTLYFGGNDQYTCVNADGVSTVTYAGVEDNSYINISASLEGHTDVSTNTMSFLVTNTGEENIQFNIDVRVGSASYVVTRSDVTYDWYNEGEHRAQYNIDAGGSRTFVLAFDTEGAAAESILMFVNSAWAETTSTHSGSFTITNITFSTAN